MSTLVIGACFLVAILAVLGLVFSLRSGDASAVVPEKVVTTAAAPAEAEASPTVPLSDAPLDQTVAPALPDASLEKGFVAEEADQLLPDTDEQDYADLPTIRSIAQHESFSGEEPSTVSFDHLQTLLEELRSLHGQMKHMEQRITVLADQVAYLRGNEDEAESWDGTQTTLKVPAQ